MHNVAILRKPQVVALTGRSYTSLRRDIKRGTFPRPVQIGPRSIGWRSEEVQAWLDARQTAALPPVQKKV